MAISQGEAEWRIGREEMFQQNLTSELASPQVAVANNQPVRLQIALVLLLVALAVVIVKDREFWFGSDEAVEADAPASENIQKAAVAAVPAKSTGVARAVVAKNHTALKTSVKPVVSQLSYQNAASANLAEPSLTNSDSPVVATTRAALPPLDVEVVAGDSHHSIHPGSSVSKVEIPSDSNRASAATTSAVSLTTNAAQHERLSNSTFPELHQTVEATYPLLGEHMRVQGSVVLQALVGVDGTIENLRVVSGPAILTAAAQQAVRQWRFKPYLQNGQAVETKARITVNFSIRISDNPPDAS
jgi:TonB family protein